VAFWAVGAGGGEVEHPSLNQKPLCYWPSWTAPVAQ
jgi:hypothetical protein